MKDREDLVGVTNGFYITLELKFCEGITTMAVGGTMPCCSSLLVGILNFTGR